MKNIYFHGLFGQNFRFLIKYNIDIRLVIVTILKFNFETFKIIIIIIICGQYAFQLINLT